jgi:hypothetical protein
MRLAAARPHRRVDRHKWHSGERYGQGSVFCGADGIEDMGGSILGRPIELLSGDHQQKPDVGAAIAWEWFDSDLAAIFDVPNAAVALGTAELASASNRVFAAGGGSASELTNTKCSPNTFPWAVDNYALGHRTGAAVLEEGGRDQFFCGRIMLSATTLEAQGHPRVWGCLSRARTSVRERRLSLLGHSQ